MLPSIKLPINGARIEVLRKTEHTAMHGRGVDRWWMQTLHKGLVCFDFIKVWVLEICTAITNSARCWLLNHTRCYFCRLQLVWLFTAWSLQSVIWKPNWISAGKLQEQGTNINLSLLVFWQLNHWFKSHNLSLIVFDFLSMDSTGSLIQFDNHCIQTSAPRPLLW